jgi:hypothetical protein
MSNFNDGDKVICIKATSSNNQLTEGETYTVKEARINKYVKLVEVTGIYYSDRFAPVPKAEAKKAPVYGEVKAVTVNKADVLHALTGYVQIVLGINASVEKIIEKFPEAVELVLKHEATA